MSRPGQGRKRKRLALIGVGAVVLAAAVALVLTALQSQITYFYSPSDLAVLQERPERAIRVGGLVVEGSVQYGADEHVAFALTDGPAELVVRYVGILPDLFREGQGIVAEGLLAADGTFDASRVLAKHDETYMPPEVADALKRQGTWKGGEAATGETPPASDY